MKKLLLLIVLLVSFKSIGQVVLENYPSASTSILQPSNFINFNTKMYYFGRTSGYQWSLYSTDGTSTGNQVVKNLGLQVANIIAQDIDAKYNDYKIVFNNKLYFAATNQLWQSDGTTAGTNVFLPAGFSNPKYFKIFNGKLYFTAESNTTGREICFTDGTIAGTSVLKDIYPGTNPSIDSQFDPHFTVFNNKLFFVANDGTTGFELWSTDGTSSGTSLFKNIRETESETNPYNQGAFKNISLYSLPPFKVVNNKMYFAANSDFTNQYGTTFRLFETDGTPNGTTQIDMPIPVNSGTTANFIQGIYGLTLVNTDLIVFGSTFVTSAGGSGTSVQSGIFKVATTNQVTQVGTIIPYAGDSGSGSDTEQGSMKFFNGEYYFIAPGATSGSNLELWKMNPTTLQFTQVSQPAAQGFILFNTNNGFSKLLLSQEWNGKLYFSKADGSNGALFSTDGTLASTTAVTKQSTTTQLVNSPLATMKSSPNQLNAFSSGLYFNASFTSGVQPTVYRFYDANLSTQTYLSNNFTTYPNPTSNVINFNSEVIMTSISIFDILGKEILNKIGNSNNETIDISNLNSGIYFTKLFFENGTSSTKKIIKN